ncbi:MAG: site-2 protease family protein [Candidatus Velamenicoccus archaeovorus]
MRRWSVPIGRVWGIGLDLHASWFLVLGLVTWATAVAFERAYPRLGPASHVSMALITAVAFFACLLAHEVAHSVVARRFGIPIHGITLFAFGGVARIEGEVPTADREFGVALVGPATSVALAGVFALLTSVATALRWRQGEGVVATLALVNLGVALFNLVPGLPLDGGRLLRAALWRLRGDRRRATRVASAGGRLVAGLLAALGLAIVLTGDVFGLWYVPMAAFLWVLARSAGRLERPGGPGGGVALNLHEGEASQPRS